MNPKLSENIFYRGITNATYLAISNMVTTILQFLSMIYVVRLLGPEDYGNWVTIGAFIGLFGIFLVQGMGKVLIREGSQNIDKMGEILNEMIALKNLCILFSMILCILSSFVVSYDSEIKIYIVMLSLTLSIDGLDSFINTIFQATENFKLISILSIIQKAFYVFFNILFLYLGYGIVGLVLSALIVRFSFLFLRYYYSRKLVRFNLLSKLKINISFLKQSLLFSLIGFTEMLYTRIDLLMISILGTPLQVGIYGVAYTLSRQISMLRNVNAMAFLPIFVKEFREKSFTAKKLLYSSFSYAGIVFLIALVISYFSESIIITLFGFEYEQSGEILSVLVFYQVFFWFSFPFTTALQSTYNEKIMLYSNLLLAIVNISLNFYLYSIYGLLGIAYSTLIVYALGMPMLCFFSFRILKEQNYFA